MISKAYKLSAISDYELVSVVVSADINTYPQNGDQDGYRYVYMGTLSAGDGLETSDATATPEDMAEGVTAYVNGVKITGTHKFAGGGLVMKSGTTTSNVIDTGLSEIQMLVLHKSGVAAQGLVQLVYRKDTGKTVSSYCMSYSTTFSTLGVNEDYKGNVNGGIFTWNGTGSAVLSENTEYNWIAVGTA